MGAHCLGKTFFMLQTSAFSTQHSSNAQRKRMQETMYFPLMYTIALLSVNGIYMHIQRQLYSMNWKRDGQGDI